MGRIKTETRPPEYQTQARVREALVREGSLRGGKLLEGSSSTILAAEQQQQQQQQHQQQQKGRAALRGKGLGGGSMKNVSVQSHEAYDEMLGLGGWDDPPAVDQRWNNRSANGSLQGGVKRGGGGGGEKEGVREGGGDMSPPYEGGGGIDNE